MKECNEIEPLLSLFANGELDAKQAQSVTHHLKTCSHCQREINEYRHLSAQLESMPSLEKQPSFWDHFYDEVAAKTIANQSRLIALLISMSAAVYRRRFAVVVSLSFILIVTAMLWYQYKPAAVEPNGTLTRLLEERDWPALYRELRSSGAQSKLLDEPVSGGLLKNFLEELALVAERDRMMRIGVNRILMDVAQFSGKSFRKGGTVQVLGVVSATRYKMTKPVGYSLFSSDMLTDLIEQLPTRQAVTLREVIDRLSGG